MKTTTSITTFALLACAAAHAGEPIAPPTEAPIEAPVEESSWFTPSLDLRTRYEFRQQQGFDPSHSLTARARFGIMLGDFNGFSLFAEGEGTQGIIEDFRSNPTGNTSTRPYVAGNTVIADPNNVELNQLFAQYKKNGFLAKVGRQRIIKNNAAFIGNVGWRQNEQTFDAALVGYSSDCFEFSYAYSNQVMRIFGADANNALPGPPLQAFEGDFHILDASYNADFGKVGGYAYLLDVENNANVGKSNTVGTFVTSGGLHAEFAYQDGTSALAGGDYSALYGHVKYTLTTDAGDFGVGVEYLGDHFKTPFATVHAFNGFADAFILQRIGLNAAGGYNGLTDIYTSYKKAGLPGGLVMTAVLHGYLDGKASSAYGYEADLVLVKKITSNLTALTKLAYFEADGASAFSNIKQVTVELGYKF
ncbi:MAG: alginate export family protein [Luteolibacter sp.]